MINSINSSPSFKGVILPKVFVRTNASLLNPLTECNNIKFTTLEQDAELIDAFNDVLRNSELPEKLLTQTQRLITGVSTRKIKESTVDPFIHKLEEVLRSVLAQPNWVISSGPKEISMSSKSLTYINRGTPSSYIKVENVLPKIDSTSHLFAESSNFYALA